MKNISFVILTSFAFGIYSCSPEQSNEISKSPKIISKLYSKNYKPPVFLNDDRSNKIKGLANEIHKTIEYLANEKHIPGIAYGVVVDNELVLASGTGLINRIKNIPASPQSGFRIASMTKSFTAMAIMKLRDEGKLNINDPIEKYIPEMLKLTYLTNDGPSIDIENLMNMSAGFPEDNPWGDRQLDEPANMIIDLIKDGISFSNTPSLKYEYSNTGYAILGNIISKVSGMSYQEYINKNILAPLGMTNTYWQFDSVPKDKLAIGYRWEDEQWKLEPMLHDGCYGAMGGLVTTIEDFSKYVSFHLSAWPTRSGKDEGIVKRSTLRKMHIPQYVRLYPSSKDYNGVTCPTIKGYGFGLATVENCNGLKIVRHGGALPGFGSDYRFYPEYGIGIMAFGNLTYTNPLPSKKIEKILFQNAEIKPRSLPVSDILAERKQQVEQLINEWDDDLANEILGENFLLDKSKDHRVKKIQEELKMAGSIISIGKLKPLNQLRGHYEMQAENGIVYVRFTLTPEKLAKLQHLKVWFEPKNPRAEI